MTNAEKFKEVFGYDIDIDAITICPFKNVETACLDKDVPCRECLDDYWYNKEYQGTPTIPLSVIEKIHTEVGNLEWYGDDAFWDGVNAVTSIIDQAIKECEHE